MISNHIPVPGAEQPLVELRSKGADMSTDHDLSLNNMLVRSALAIPEVRKSVREDLRAQGKLPHFTPERIAALSRSIQMEYEEQR